MSKNKNILIVASDFLQSFGLKSMLEDYSYTENFSYTVVINDDFAENEILYDLIFISQQHYFSLYEKMKNIRKKVIVLTTTNTPIADFSTLNCCMEEDSLAELLHDLCVKKLHYKVDSDRTELSDREKEVLVLVAKGYMNKQIADTLNISINTVLTHRKNLTAKLGIKTVSGITMYAMLNGLISGEDIQ